MREFDRRRLTEAKSASTSATPEELREAAQRYKEQQSELRQTALMPETKQGEDRLDRYERAQRLRSMRDQFQDATGTYPRPPRNSALLALVMAVSSFLLCAFCGGSTYFGLQLLNQKPSAMDVANGFWTAMEAKDYTTAHDAYISPSLTLQLTVDTFTNQAQQADSQFGPVTSVALVHQATNSKTSVSLTYAVTRTDSHNAKHLADVTLILLQVRNNWGISDIGTLFTTPASPSTTPSTSGQPATNG